ncbi:MAG: hypothetical protein K2Z81_16665 [Cyanobacteria bacterium]|nr:hypothetical protein [Cyanobacteriota bacterium]
MNSEPQKELPVGLAAACKQLDATLKGRSRSYQSLTYRLLKVRSLFVEERYYSARVRNPRYRGFWKLLEPEYINGSSRGLSYLYADGNQEGRLHGGSEGQALALQQMLSAGGEPVDLVVSGHFTESGWYIDSIRVSK